MPAPTMLRAETVARLRQRRPRATVPFVYIHPTVCPNGVPWNPSRVAAEERACAVPTSPALHLPPVNGRSTLGEYAIPNAPCGADGAGHHAGCEHCTEQHTRYQNEIRRYPEYSTTFTEVEKALNRRLRYREFILLYGYICNYGIVGLLQRTNYLGALSFVESLDYAQRERNHNAMHNRAFVEWQNLRRNEEQANQRTRSQREQNEARRSDAIANALNSEQAHISLEGGPGQPSYPDESNEDGECPCGCRWYSEAEAGSRCSCHESESPRYRPRGTERRSPMHGIPFIVPKKAPPGINRRLVGIELEYNETTDMSKWVQKWNGAVHSDGSCGWEAVTTPIAGGHIDACVRDMTTCLRRAGTTADERCGVHVHVDAQDVMWADMFRILTVYGKLEPLLYLIAGQNRLDGTYSKACGEAFANACKHADVRLKKEAVLAAAYNRPGAGATYARQRPGKKDGGRYKGLNIIPWLVGRSVKAPDTTIEFRMHRNSLEASRIIGWTHLLARVVEWCTKASDAEVAALPTSALKCIKIISPESVSYVLRRISEWRGACTAEKKNRSSASGVRMPRRRISVKKGVWTLCAA